MRLRVGFGSVLACGLAIGGMPAMTQDNMEYIGTSLFGEQVPGKGAGEDAAGDFSAELDLGAGRMCYMLEVEGLGEVTAAHIHAGALGKTGEALVPLELLGDDGDDICVDVDVELLKKIAKNKARYYVNVHTAEFPEGAIRGQLSE